MRRGLVRESWVRLEKCPRKDWAQSGIYTGYPLDAVVPTLRLDS